MEQTQIKFPQTFRINCSNCWRQKQTCFHHKHATLLIFIWKLFCFYKRLFVLARREFKAKYPWEKSFAPPRCNPIAANSRLRSLMHDERMWTWWLAMRLFINLPMNLKKVSNWSFGEKANRAEAFARRAEKPFPIWFMLRIKYASRVSWEIRFRRTINTEQSSTAVYETCIFQFMTLRYKTIKWVRKFMIRGN